MDSRAKIGVSFRRIFFVFPIFHMKFFKIHYWWRFWKTGTRNFEPLMKKNPKISKKWKFEKSIFRHFGALWLIFSKNECDQSIPRIKFSGWVFLVHVKSSFQCDFRAKKPVQKYEFLVIFWIFLHFKGLELILGKNGYDHWIPRLKLYYWVFFGTCQKLFL